MKKINLIFSLIFLFAFANPSFGQGVITGSAHDFSGNAWNTSGEICIVCHTPHNANATYTPLWDHDVTAVAFTPYTSPTFDGTAVDPVGTSRLCLSCHDGTIALESFGGATGTNFIAGAFEVGASGTLAHEHPIGFDYTTALATTDGGLHDPSTTNSGEGGTITADWLFANSLECASCHDVHNNGLGTSSLLRVSNAASALCLTCHSK